MPDAGAMPSPWRCPDIHDAEHVTDALDMIAQTITILESKAAVVRSNRLSDALHDATVQLIDTVADGIKHAADLVYDEDDAAERARIAASERPLRP